MHIKTLNMAKLPFIESKHKIRAPEIRSTIINNEFVVKIANKTRELSTISIPFIENLDCEQLLNEIERKCKELKVKTVQIGRNDLMFVFTKSEKLKQMYLQSHRKVRIVIYNPIKRNDDPTEQSIIIKTAHISQQTGEHFSRTKTIARILSQYYWQGVSRQAAIFVKNCEKCKNNKSPPANKATQNQAAGRPRSYAI